MQFQTQSATSANAEMKRNAIPQMRKLRFALIFYFETLRKLRCGLKFLKFIALRFQFFSLINSPILYIELNCT